jgi:23S rRNA pseudouridine1911/1915/1917 synthase
MAGQVYVCGEGDAGARLDKVLAVGLGVSRASIHRWMEGGCVRARGGGKASRKDKAVAGMAYEIDPPPAQPMELAPEDRPLDILFEDTDIIALNKPPGVVVHPGAGHAGGTLVAALLHHCRGKLSGIGGVERPGIVHRLDKDTSGILLVAKNDQAHVELARQFHDRLTRKTYLAWVVGGPRLPAGSWHGPIGRHPIHRQKMAVIEQEGKGRQAHTDYRLVRRVGGAALLELDLHTGRTHQIRVHCNAAGCPVAGDGVYGRQPEWVRKAGAHRQLLHAWKLHFQHPGTEKSIELAAPVPEDFLRFEENLGRLRP